MSTTTAYPTNKQVRLPGVGREIEDVLLWRDVKVSAAAFVGLTLLYLLLEWSGYSLLTIVCNTLLALVSGAFIWSYVAKFTGRSGVPLPRVVREGVSEGHVKQFAQNFTAVINKGLSFVNRLTSGEDVILSVEVAGGLYVAAKIGNYFSSLGLLYTLVVLAFTVPKLYELKKDDIDQAVSTASYHGKKNYTQYVEPYVKKIPKASTSSTTSASTSTIPSKPAAFESEADSFQNVSKQDIPSLSGHQTGAIPNYPNQQGQGQGQGHGLGLGGDASGSYAPKKVI
ncbi:hypothetical protein WJX73_001657 [Symbiochloris irregularis]|uniref:Reticulon-like protein n=1 Tax=Symbiochloris irregularis TaxID=706552 RepID=A0AAW1PDK1_9CHLO